MAREPQPQNITRAVEVVAETLTNLEPDALDVKFLDVDELSEVVVAALAMAGLIRGEP